MKQITEVIRQIEVFQGLSAPQLEQVAGMIRRESYNSGDVIIQQDDDSDSMYMIGQGQVEVRQRGARGEQRTTLFLGEGQIFGELALLDQGFRTATVVADEEPTVLYKLTRNDFETLCTTDSVLGYLIMRNIALDLAFKLRHQNLDN